MRVTIDRFEGEYAIVETENGDFVNMPSVLVPGSSEGDIIEITINTTETKKREQQINKLMDNLFED